MAHAAIDRLPDLKTKSGLARSTLYKLVAAKLWTPPIRLSARAVGWPTHETDALINARTSGKTDADIRALVMQLEAARQNAGMAAA